MSSIKKSFNSNSSCIHSVQKFMTKDKDEDPLKFESTKKKTLFLVKNNKDGVIVALKKRGINVAE